jgi:putative N6-adenine-specific DNA methylase
MRASQAWTFFCVVTPGLEELALAEYRAKRAGIGTDVDAAMINGGLEVTLPWEAGRGLTKILKIPTRVLVRLKTLKARDFPTLFQKTRDLPWTQWLVHPEPHWKVTAHQCRLMHTGRVEETLRAALKKSQERQPLSLRWQKESLAAETVYIRGVDDEWTFSLDITGEPLYKRGTQHVDADAPIRETLAAAVLSFMFAGQDQDVHLWDPLCGSGTFLFEALSYHLPTARSFPWEKSQLNLGVRPWRPTTALTAFPLLSARGHDRNADLIAQLPAEHFGVHDVFEEAARPCGDPLWIVSNPPYGERLLLPEGISPFTQKLGQALSALSPQKVCLVVPAAWPDFAIGSLKNRQRLSFSNGGLATEARTWT